VTVGIPVFNGERFIRQAIESVLAQTFTDYELLISDNASEDGTAAICREFAAIDRRIKFIQQENNRGPFWNLKYVTDGANGRLLVWLAHDDALDRLFIEECVAYLDRNPRAVIVSGDFRIVDESGNQIDMEILQTIREGIPWVQRCSQFFRYPIFSNVFYAFYGMMRVDACRAALSEVKEPKYMSQIELPVLARFATMGEIASLPTVLRDYRRVSTSLYHSEMNSLSRKSRFARSIIQSGHISRLILDQVSVLLRSHFPLIRKFAVLLRVGAYYCMKFGEISFGRRRSRR
jgi:glycosyltransferase involved in cell wall biosynthesis